MHYELSLDQLLKHDSHYYVQDCASVSFKMGDVDMRLPILKGPLGENQHYYKSEYYRPKLAQSAAYVLQNTNTGHFYIGRSIAIHHRIIKHIHAIRTKTHENRNLVKFCGNSSISDWNLVILFVTSKEESVALEQYLMDMYAENPLKLNIATDSEKSMLNASEESRKLVSIANKTEKAMERGRRQLLSYLANPEWVAKRTAINNELFRIKVMAYGTLHESLLAAHTKLNIQEYKFRNMLDDPNYEYIYRVDTDAKKLLAEKHSCEDKTVMAARMQDDLQKYEREHVLLISGAKKVVLNKNKYPSAKACSRGENIDVNIINKLIRKTELNSANECVITIPDSYAARGPYSKRIVENAIQL